MLDEDDPLSPLRRGAFGLAATLTDIGRTRLALAAVELQEERLRLARQGLLAVATLYLGSFALLLACACIVWAVPPELRLWTLLALLVLVGAAAAACAWQWRSILQDRPPLLAATLRELQRDVEALRAGGAP